MKMNFLDLQDKKYNDKQKCAIDQLEKGRKAKRLSESELF